MAKVKTGETHAHEYSTGVVQAANRIRGDASQRAQRSATRRVTTRRLAKRRTRESPNCICVFMCDIGLVGQIGGTRLGQPRADDGPRAPEPAIPPSFIRLQQALPQMERRNLEAHKRIVKTIAAGNAELAHHWIRKHMMDFQCGYALAGLPTNAPLQMHQLENAPR